MSTMSRIGMISRHLNIVSLAPRQHWGYTIQIDVSHREKVIDFITESLTHNDRMVVFMAQKRMMREMYPEYIITELHHDSVE
tara:strand:+ start:26441 stop:26686 length:246 start_codon:yes stop_codon:yes gene_type:complete